MRLRSFILTAPLVLATTALAEGEFAAGSEAESWGLFGEEKARFEARVVDVVCALTGDCPPDCGGGERQMALIRTTDDVMVLATKNGQPVFSGATHDLAPYCGQTVEVDGLLVGDAGFTPALGAKVFQVQRVRAEGADEWQPAHRFTEAWAERNAGVGGDGPWFRRDPAVNSRIETEGHLGLGLEIDRAFIEAWY